MSTLSVPLTRDLEKFVESMVKNGEASNKADVVRRALKKYAEDKAVEAVLRSEREYKEGKVLEGDLDELAAKLS